MDEKPGVMIYFDLIPVLERLNTRQMGLLFQAILNYGKYRCVPDLPSPLCLFWPLIQMHLDADDARYREVSNKRRYAAYVRWANQRDKEPMSYAEWLCNQDDDED